MSPSQVLPGQELRGSDWQPPASGWTQPFSFESPPPSPLVPSCVQNSVDPQRTLCSLRASPAGPPTGPQQQAAGMVSRHVQSMGVQRTDSTERDTMRKDSKKRESHGG